MTMYTYKQYIEEITAVAVLGYFNKVLAVRLRLESPFTDSATVCLGVFFISDIRGGGKGMSRLKMNDYKRRWNNSTRRWVYEHREVMEKHLGGELAKGEHIHHINGDHTDNRIENLEITCLSAHMSLHKPVRQRVWRPVKGPIAG